MRPIRSIALSTAVVLLAGGCAGASTSPASTGWTAPALPPAPTNVALREELVRMHREDQAAREGLGAAMAANDTTFAKRMLAGDSLRSARLRTIVQQHGWPTPALVGRDGVDAAWFILQHSPSLELQRALLPAVETAARRGDMSMRDVAMLTDRVLVREGKPQRYGHSFSVVDGKLVVDPVEDPARLDERRAAMGLRPMSEYVLVLRRAYELPVVWPPQP
ncbi:MAG TPA: DUF6624 domain-containing protein [Gemmatimonadaceae bacterium]|nr:DUF6624 domain-containing protein [Gemmatimonadaceae bacterium]